MPSEREIVREALFRDRALRRRGLRLRRWGHYHRLVRYLRHCRASVLLGRQEGEGVGLHFSYVVFNAVGIVPVAGAQTALHIDLPAFGEILLCQFGQVAPHHNVVPLRDFDTVAILVLPVLGGGHREARFLAAVFKSSDFRVSSEITH